MRKFLLKTFMLLLIILLGLGAFLGFRGYTEYEELTKEKPLETLVQEVESKLEFVPYEMLSSNLVDATISIEDRRFYKHDGVDIIGLGRAILSQFISELQTSGGSTITQQVAKNLYGMFESSIDRKLVEYFLAKELESKYSKNEILALYVNIINYGDGYTGIYEASNGYFQKMPYDLDLAQASLLAGLPQSPANYQLSNHFEDAKARQLQVLKAMSEEGHLDKSRIDVIYNQNVYGY